MKVKFLGERFRAKNNSKDGCTGATEATVLVIFVTLQMRMKMKSKPSKVIHLLKFP